MIVKVYTKFKGRIPSLSTLALIGATFFNPLGFDALFALVTQWTGSYIITDILFYLASALLFFAYWALRRREKSRLQTGTESPSN